MKKHRKIKMPLYPLSLMINFDPFNHGKLCDDGVESDLERYSAVVQYNPKKGHVTVTFDPKEYGVGVLSHESVHVAWKVLELCGVECYCDNHEALAYLVGWVSKTIENYRLDLVRKGAL